MNKNELAKLYGIDIKTFKRKINRDSIKVSLSNLGYEERQRYLTPAQVECIFRHLGKPIKK